MKSSCIPMFSHTFFISFSDGFTKFIHAPFLNSLISLNSFLAIPSPLIYFSLCFYFIIVLCFCQCHFSRVFFSFWHCFLILEKVSFWDLLFVYNLFFLKEYTYSFFFCSRTFTLKCVDSWLFDSICLLIITFITHKCDISSFSFF